MFLVIIPCTFKKTIVYEDELANQYSRNLGLQLDDERLLSNIYDIQRSLLGLNQVCSTMIIETF